MIKVNLLLASWWLLLEIQCTTTLTECWVGNYCSSRKKKSLHWMN